MQTDLAVNQYLNTDFDFVGQSFVNDNGSGETIGECTFERLHEQLDQIGLCI